MEVNGYIITAEQFVALATFILAIAAFSAIRQNRNLQRKERRERLLNEVIEWARKSAESAIYRQGIGKHELWSAKLNYKNCKAVSGYIKEIAASSFPTLSFHIDNVVTKLGNAIEGTTRFIDSKSDDHDRMRNCEEELTNAVIELFKEVAKIKAKV